MAAEPSLETQRADTLRRLAAVRAVSGGISRLADVLPAISASEDEQEALDTIAALLDLPASGARLILSTPFGQLTRSNIVTLLAERDALERKLASLRDSDDPS